MLTRKNTSLPTSFKENYWMFCHTQKNFPSCLSVSGPDFTQRPPSLTSVRNKRRVVTSSGSGEGAPPTQLSPHVAPPTYFLFTNYFFSQKVMPLPTTLPVLGFQCVELKSSSATPILGPMERHHEGPRTQDPTTPPTVQTRVPVVCERPSANNIHFQMFSFAPKFLQSG